MFETILPLSSCSSLLPSYNQERALVGSEAVWAGGGGGRFHIVEARSILGPLQPEILEESLNRVVARHDGLRAAFAPNPEISGAERAGFLDLMRKGGPPPPNLHLVSIAPSVH